MERPALDRSSAENQGHLRVSLVKGRVHWRDPFENPLNLEWHSGIRDAQLQVCLDRHVTRPPDPQPGRCCPTLSFLGGKDEDFRGRTSC